MTLKYIPADLELYLDVTKIKKAMESDKLKGDVVQLIAATFVMNEERAYVEVTLSHTRLRAIQPHPAKTYHARKALLSASTAAAPAVTQDSKSEKSSVWRSIVKRVHSTLFASAPVDPHHAKKTDAPQQDDNPSARKKLRTGSASANADPNTEQEIEEKRTTAKAAECVAKAGLSALEEQTFMPLVLHLHRRQDDEPSRVHCNITRVSPEEFHFEVNNHPRLSIADCADIFEVVTKCSASWSTTVYWNFKKHNFVVKVDKVRTASSSSSSSSSAAAAATL